MLRYKTHTGYRIHRVVHNPILYFESVNLPPAPQTPCRIAPHLKGKSIIFGTLSFPFHLLLWVFPASLFLSVAPRVWVVEVERQVFRERESQISQEEMHLSVNYFGSAHCEESLQLVHDRLLDQAKRRWVIL